MTEQDGSERDEPALEPEEVKDLDLDEEHGDDVRGGPCTKSHTPAVQL